MSTKYFKVVSPLDQELIINTEITNYSSSLERAKELENSLLIMSYFSSKFCIPINVLCLLNNGFANFGELYKLNFPKSHYGIFTADQFTKDDDDKNFLIKETDLLDFIQTMNKVGFNYFYEGFYIWEFLFEQVRERVSLDLPKRTDSFFLFESIADCQRYMDEENRTGDICEVEIIENRKIFRADMSLINEIPNSFTAAQVYSVAEKYWNSEAGLNPLYEVIFKGKCRLKPLKSMVTPCYSSKHR